MYTDSTARPEAASARGNALHASVNAVQPAALQMQTGPPDWQFIAMLDAYRESGGLMRAPELGGLWQRHGISGADLLAYWILKRSVISFEWQSTLWLPMVQFNRSTMTLVPGFEEIHAELVPVLNNSEVAQWFCLPNPWLEDRSPANALVSSAPEVLLAARVERRSRAH